MVINISRNLCVLWFLIFQVYCCSFVGNYLFNLDDMDLYRQGWRIVERWVTGQSEFCALINFKELCDVKRLKMRWIGGVKQYLRTVSVYLRLGNLRQAWIIKGPFIGIVIRYFFFFFFVFREKFWSVELSRSFSSVSDFIFRAFRNFFR